VCLRIFFAIISVPAAIVLLAGTLLAVVGGGKWLVLRS
jgi:hypothetical protein